MLEKMDAVILAGGLGTRLRSVVSDTPKCLVEVNNLPFLTYKIKQLQDAGVQHIILCIGYMADRIEQYFDENPIPGLSIAYAYEHDLLGTAGAFKNAEPLIQTENFLALNGDVYLDLNYKAFVAQHLETMAKATLALVSVSDPSRFGLVRFNDELEIQAFLEKQPPNPDNMSNGAYYINAGTYCLHRSIFNIIPDGQPCSIEKEIFPLLVDDGFYAFPLNTYFIDIGTPESFQQVQQDIMNGKLRVTY